jgi:hypothetical protein
MTEDNEGNGGKARMNRVAVTAIIVAGVVLLACIIASTVIVLYFLANVPW